MLMLGLDCGQGATYPAVEENLPKADGGGGDVDQGRVEAVAAERGWGIGVRF